MTTRFPSRPAAAWMLEHRGKIVAALAGGLTATIAVVGAATWANSDASDSQLSTSTVSYPSSREGVRGHVAFDSVGSGLTAGAVQPSSAESKFPASRENARGQVFDGAEASAISPALQQPPAEPKFPASRDGQRGHVEGDGSPALGVTSDAIQQSAQETRVPSNTRNARGPIFD